MEKRYKEIDGVKYQVIQNTILGSNVVPVGETLPEVTTSDNGKLLGVSSGEWTPVDAPSSLPDITGNAGKVLKVNAGATGTEWANETTELPAVTAADEGDVLTVNASGEWEAAAPGGGGGGLTLYGPYVFTSSTPVTIGVSQLQSISLSEITRYEDQASVTLESDAPFVFLLAGYSVSQDCKLTGIDPTDYYQGECTPPQIWLYNDSDSSVSVSGNTLMAYLSIDLPTAN